MSYRRKVVHDPLKVALPVLLFLQAGDHGLWRAYAVASGVPAHHLLTLPRVRTSARSSGGAALVDLGVSHSVDAYFHRSPFLLLSASATTPGRHFTAGHSCHSPVKGSRMLMRPGPDQRTLLSRSGSSLGSLTALRDRNLSRIGLNSTNVALSSSVTTPAGASTFRCSP